MIAHIHIINRYGPYKKGEVVECADYWADYVISKGVAEEISKKQYEAYQNLILREIMCKASLGRPVNWDP